MLFNHYRRYLDGFSNQSAAAMLFSLELLAGKNHILCFCLKKGAGEYGVCLQTAIRDDGASALLNSLLSPFLYISCTLLHVTALQFQQR